MADDPRAPFQPPRFDLPPNLQQGGDWTVTPVRAAPLPAKPAEPVSTPIWDTVTALGDQVRSASDWLRSKLPTPSPAIQAAAKQVEARAAAEPPGGIARFFGSKPVQQVGQYLTEQYATPPADVTALGEFLHGEIAKRGDARRAALTSHGLSGFEPLFEAQQDWIPNLAIDTAVDVHSPAGAAMNVVDAGPVLHAAAPFLGKAAAALGALPPGFFSRVDEVGKLIPKKGIHPNKLASELKSRASSAEVAFRRINDLIAGKGNQLISKAEFEAHLAAHPPPEITRTVLGEHANPYDAHVQKMIDRYGEGYDLDQLTPAEQADQARLWREAAHRPSGMTAGNTKYESYTLPGGENYRESLLQLRDPHMAQRVTLEQEKRALGQRVDQRSPDMGRQELDDLIARYDAKQAEIDALPPETAYQSSHFDQPNILVHTRTNERLLPPQGVRSVAEIEAIIQRAVNARTPESLASGAPDVAQRKGLINAEEAALYGHSKGFTNYPEPPGSRGRYVEEVQSDWGQAGEKRGYRGAPDPADQQRIDELTGRIEQGRRESAEGDQALQEAGRVYHEAMTQHTRALLPPEFAHITSLDEAFEAAANGHHEALEAWRAARERARPLAQDLRDAETAHNARLGEVITQVRDLEHERNAVIRKNLERVPDMPFKDTWPDLALKQQLLDVANHPDLSWLGLSSGKTQAARYDLSKQIKSLNYDPDTNILHAFDHEGNVVMQETVPRERLDDYIGKEPADKLRTQIEAHKDALRQNYDYLRERWHTEIDPESGQFMVIDPDGDPQLTWEGVAELYPSERAAAQHIDELIGSSYESELAAGNLPTLEGLDLQVGGEGMTHFYDNLLPKRLEKLVKPFGGTVERGTVPAGLSEAAHGTRALGEAFFDAAHAGSLIDGKLPVGPSRRLYSRDQLGTAFLSGELNAFSMPNYLQDAVQRNGVQEPAWIARLSPEVKERMRQTGFPLMSFLPPALIGGAAAASQLGGDEDGQGGGAGLAAAAAVPFALPKGGGSIARALKRTNQFGEYALRAPIIERLRRLYEYGGHLPASSWGGPEAAERLLQGFDNDADLARRWGRLWGATSPNTSVPVNTRESMSALAHTLINPNEPFEYSMARQLPGAQITMAGSKVPNMNRAMADQPLSGDKVEAMANFMTGQPRIPIDVHALYALGTEGDKLDQEIPGLRRLMTEAEDLPPRGALSNTDIYRRVEDAFGRALRGVTPQNEDLGQSFAQLWEGTRGYKGLLPQGAPVDILGAQGLLETGALTDPERIREALKKRQGWIFKSK